MMKGSVLSEICRRTIKPTSERIMTVVYYLTASETEEFPGITQYGVAISVEESGERSITSAITPDRNKALEFIDMLAHGDVTPVSLRDIVCDLILN